MLTAGVAAPSRDIGRHGEVNSSEGWGHHECLHVRPGHGGAAPLLAGHNGAFVAGWAHFDAAAFALAPAEALVMDPQQRLLLQVGLALRRVSLSHRIEGII